MNRQVEDRRALAHRRNMARRRRGAAAVEFALVAPVIVLLMLGIIEFGRAIMVQEVLTNAAREGTRVGVLPSSTTAQAESTVNNYLSGASITGATVSVNPSPPGSAAYGSNVTVTVKLPFSSVSWLAAPLFLKNATLSAQCVMRTEVSQ